MTEALIDKTDEEELRLLRGADGQLWASSPDRTCPVRPVRCFPWTEPYKQISLRDREDEEVAWVHDLFDLEPESRRALAASLVEAGFVLVIDAVTEIDEEIEIRTFQVRTRQGPRSFQTRRDEWPRAMERGGLLFTDVVGDLYLVPDPKALDAKSQRLLFAFTD